MRRGRLALWRTTSQVCRVETRYVGQCRQHRPIKARKAMGIEGSTLFWQMFAKILPCPMPYEQLERIDQEKFDCFCQKQRQDQLYVASQINNPNVQFAKYIERPRPIVCQSLLDLDCLFATIASSSQHFNSHSSNAFKYFFANQRVSETNAHCSALSSHSFNAFVQQISG